MRVRVVTDSSASVPDEYLTRLGIGEALATVNFGSESYFAKAEVPLETFYRRLETAEKLPTTSQPPPEQFVRAYERAAAAGADEIVAVCVSSKLSGTFNSAVIAAQASPVPVQVWDTQHISMAAGYQAITAAELRETVATASRSWRHWQAFALGSTWRSRQQTCGISWPAAGFPDSAALWATY